MSQPLVCDHVPLPHHDPARRNEPTPLPRAHRDRQHCPLCGHEVGEPQHGQDDAERRSRSMKQWQMPFTD